MAKAPGLRADVAEWLDAHPDATGPQVAEAFGVTRQTGSSYKRRWLALRGEPPPNSAPTKKPRNPAAGRAPVERMDPNDRERALAVVRDTYALIAATVARMRARVEGCPEGAVPEIDRDTSQALLSLQKTAVGMIDAHPGLMDLVRQEEGKGVEGDELAQILASMRSPDAPKGPKAGDDPGG